ncbi:MAG: hypothetical protein P9L99_18080 [Candidatus Lernaella stagnicola]|nr:hypothetical protein [Candidatus Lernaella stagnicola]
MIIIHHRDAGTPKDSLLEVIDFAGISGIDIDEKLFEWGKPDASLGGALSEDSREGGQGNGGKSYLRELFEKGYFVSICDGRLSVARFIDPSKHILDFVPDCDKGKDYSGINPELPTIRTDASLWCESFDYPPDHNVTIVRGISPKKPVNLDRLLNDIQAEAQARETIKSCRVLVFRNHKIRRELAIRPPTLHPSMPEPIEIEIPDVLEDDNGEDVVTCVGERFPRGKLVLCFTREPLSTSERRSWNFIDFYGSGITSIGRKRARDLGLQFGHFCEHVYGECHLSILTAPDDNYELQARKELKDGPLSEALFTFIASEADKRLESIAKIDYDKTRKKKSKGLDQLNEYLATWFESKMTTAGGLTEHGTFNGGIGKKRRDLKTARPHSPAVEVKINKQSLVICEGVTHPLRAIGRDENGIPVPCGKILWRSTNAAVVKVHPDKGEIEAIAEGLAAITVEIIDSGLMSKPLNVQVIIPEKIELRDKGPIEVGSNRRFPLDVKVKTKRRVFDSVALNWSAEEPGIATVGPDGILVGGEVGKTKVWAHAGLVESDRIEVVVERGSAGKPLGGGVGKPRILLSGHHLCPFTNSDVILSSTNPAVYQRPGYYDAQHNVFWINLQHPLAKALHNLGEASVQWRMYHFQRMLDVYTIIELRRTYADSEELDVDKVLDEINAQMAVIFMMAANEKIFDVLVREKIDLSKL